MNTDEQWELWGSRDPYFGVITHPRFRNAALTAEAKQDFFHSGRVHADYVLQTCRSRIDAGFAPERLMDFGCGVGRVVVPFAALAAEVVGLDVSPSMLAEARRNCEAFGLRNVALLQSDDTLSAVQGGFDLVHSCIVLQHIPVPRGRQLFERLVGLLRPGGIAAIHVTYAWDLHAATYGQVPPVPPTAAEGLAARARAKVRRAMKGADDASRGDPEMQMNYYNLSELMFIAQRAGARHWFADFTDHGGALGAFLFFQKRA